MRKVTHGIWFALLCGCITESSKEAADTAPSGIIYADCDTVLPVVDWTEGTAIVESIEGVDEELATIDLSELPDPVDISGLLALYKGFVASAFLERDTRYGF